MMFSTLMIGGIILTIIVNLAIVGAGCLIASITIGMIDLSRKRAGHSANKHLSVLSKSLALGGIIALIPLILVLMLAV